MQTTLITSRITTGSQNERKDFEELGVNYVRKVRELPENIHDEDDDLIILRLNTRIGLCTCVVCCTALTL